MSGNVNFGNLHSTTIDNYLHNFKDNYTKHSRLLEDIKKAGNIKTEDGGNQILEQIEFAANGSFGWYQGSEQFELANKKAFTAAAFPRKYAYVTSTIVGDEEVSNSGKERMIDLIEAKVSNAMKSLGNGLAVSLYSDGTAPKQLGGLQYLIADAPATGIVGGIDASQTDNTWWRNYSKSVALDETNVISVFNEAIQKTTRNNDRVKVVYTDNSSYNKYYNALQAQQRFIDSTKGDGGYSDLAINGIPLKNDQAMNGFCPAGHSYFINSDFLKFRPNSKRNPYHRPSISSINQDASVEAILWAGNMTVSGREFQGVVVDTAATE